MGHYDELRDALSQKQRKEQSERNKIQKYNYLRSLTKTSHEAIMEELSSIKAEINLIKTILANEESKNEND